MTLIRILALFITFCIDVSAQDRLVQKETLLNGWYLWDPYQYTIHNEGAGDTLTGLDIELVKAITTAAKAQVVYEPVSWRQHQEDLKNGKRDFAAGATYTAERAKFVHFSAPYRFEENSLFIRRHEESRLQFKTIVEFLHQVKQRQFRLGVIEGYIYADPEINKWLEDPANQKLIVKANNDLENINLLLDEKIDGFLADRVVGATLIWRANHGDRINEIRLGIKTPIHLMFSKKTVPLAQVEEFNKAIEEVKSSSTYNKIISWYLHPVLLLQTIDTNWFHFIEIMGTIAFAISGLVIAYQKRATLFGAFLLAVLPSLGGGIIRDVIFNRKPIGALQSPLYLSLVLATVLIGFISLRLYSYWQRKKISKEEKYLTYKSKHVPEHILATCDAMGLAAFTITGIVVSVMAKVSPLWLWGAFFAFLTGAGGGILRDLISGSKDVVSLRGGIYPEIAIFWGFSLSLFLMWQTNDINPEAIKYGVMLHVIGAFLTRLIVYFLKIPNIHFRKESISSEI
ncbi:MAG: TRIC cation channel family protein [Candidatus Paracaedimonas acanthamoebae]|uniref:TRIC cation channel family protein n=1 Tax=Candidatus Paracaedimonas acanthamoebae TaxID=244581 RepID=A0A8J7PVC4_9PROT|nr:TRIC cation channel family protein [Candidatus Paracaedimonas acanthamoebae]